MASGRYQQAEFAADLWQVHLGEGTDEYRDPVEFFRRTYLTESLKAMLVGAVRRLAGQGGDPVVQLQTNFGGGKTHSMLALYHLFSGIAPSELAGIDAVMQEAGAKTLPAVRRVVLVGNKISPGNPVVKPDGTVVRTLWGELAWQLGGKTAFARIQADDERATSPGDVLRELFKEYGPCLILIDEWVAYARQLHDQSDLPAGSFETQFTFAQVLTESAKLAQNCLLVISLPASDTAGSPHTQADDVEVGGQRGREALDRLRNVVGRVESSWRPASAEEGFEIVRRRLFEPLADPAQFKDRDVVARAFADLYRTQHQEFPPECRDADYEKRIKAAYPIHPEIFDRLYTDWSTLVKFQRTRGVLRLMAAVIHSLWEKGDRNPLILPANIADRRPARAVRADALPLGQLGAGDREGRGRPELAAAAAGRRGAQPRQVRRLPPRGAHHLPGVGAHGHRRAPRARGPAGQARLRDAGRVAGGLRRCPAAAGRRGHLPLPGRPALLVLDPAHGHQAGRGPRRAAQARPGQGGAGAGPAAARGPGAARATSAASIPCRSRAQDVPDDLDARLVVLGVDHPYSKEPGSAAETAAKAILESRGNTPRLYRNTLVFLAADKTRLQDLDEAARKYLAWESILAEKEALNLDPQQVKQAETQKAGGRRRRDGAAAGDLPVAARAGAGDAAGAGRRGRRSG